MHEFRKDSFLISTDPALLQFDRIHAFLTKAYWSMNVPRSVVEKAARNSICFGVYDNNLQVGYARVATDFATFAWVADVYIEESHRGRGLAKWLMECLLSVPQMRGLRRICLKTRDAQGLYAKFGFVESGNPSSPSHWMEIVNNEIYQKNSSP